MPQMLLPMLGRTSILAILPKLLTSLCVHAAHSVPAGVGILFALLPPPHGGSFLHTIPSSVVATHTVKHVIVVLEEVHVAPIENRFQLAKVEIHHSLHSEVVRSVRIRIYVHVRRGY